MKKLYVVGLIAAIIAFMAVAVAQAETVVYQSDFTGIDLGAGLVNEGILNTGE